MIHALKILALTVGGLGLIGLVIAIVVIVAILTDKGNPFE